MAERLAPRPDLLVGNSTEIAKGAEQKTRELLGRHPTLVASEVVDLIAKREAASALQEYGKARLAGHTNNNHSLKPR